MTGWRAFWWRVFSLETARFVLALLALIFSASALAIILLGLSDIEKSKETVVTFALGQMFALAMLAFNRYFGRATDEMASGKEGDPLHVEPDK